MSSDNVCGLVCGMLTWLHICCYMAPKGSNKGKCLCCIPVHHACLGFGILTAILNGIVLLYCIVLECIMGVGFAKAEAETDPEIRGLSLSMLTTMGLTVGVGLAILGVASLIGFIFSVLLCNGISNRRPGQVKSYLVYGWVITILIVLAAILQMIYDDQPMLGFVALLGVGFYMLVLMLVYQTYTQLRTAQGTNNHIKLVEEYVY